LIGSYAAMSGQRIEGEQLEIVKSEESLNLSMAKDGRLLITDAESVSAYLKKLGDNSRFPRNLNRQ